MRTLTNIRLVRLRMPQDESKHARRKAMRSAEKAKMKGKIRRLEKNAKIQDTLRKKQEKEITEQAERIEKLEKKIERLEKTIHKQADRLDQHTNDLNRANLLQKTTVDSTVLPIIAAILYKSIYQIGFGKSYQEPHFGDNRDERLRAKENEFRKFGMLSVEEMRLFADTVSSEISCTSPMLHANLICLSGPQLSTNVILLRTLPRERILFRSCRSRVLGLPSSWREVLS